MVQREGKPRRVEIVAQFAWRLRAPDEPLPPAKLAVAGEFHELDLETGHQDPFSRCSRGNFYLRKYRKWKNTRNN